MELIMAVAGAAVGWVLLTWFQARQQYRKDLDAAIQKIISDLIITRVEVHHGLYYLFREDDGAFVAQGHDVQQLRDNLRLRFQHKQVVVNGDIATIDQLRAQLSALEDSPMSQS